MRLFLFRGVRNSLSGRRRTDDAFVEDVVQLALVRILERLNQFEGRSAFTTWALAIAIRVAFTELRRKVWNNVSLEELKEKAESLLDAADTAPDPHDSLARKSLIAAMHQSIHDKLTPRQKDVLLASLNAMPQDEIAQQMGITRNAVYKLGHDARKALKRALEAAGYGAEQVRDVLEMGQGRSL